MPEPSKPEGSSFTITPTGQGASLGITNLSFGTLGAGPSIGGAGGGGAITPGVLPAMPPGFSTVGGTASTSATRTAGTEMPILPTGPYPNRTLPSWLPSSPDAITPELADQYGKVNAAYDTTAIDAAAKEQQAQDLTAGLTAANNAAAEYAAKTRQQGGSGAAAGAVKAQGDVTALRSAASEKLDLAKFDAQQREAAASQSAQIASTLSGLRSDYLRTLTGYAASEDATGTGRATATAGAGVDTTGKGGAGGGGGLGGNFSPGYVTDQGPVVPSSNSNAITPRVYGVYPSGG